MAAEEQTCFWPEELTVPLIGLSAKPFEPELRFQPFTPHCFVDGESGD